MSQEEANVPGFGFYRGTNEGSKLAGNYNLWTSMYSADDLVNDGEFGASGFTALPSGYRGNLQCSDADGCYDGYAHMGFYGAFWSSTAFNNDHSVFRGVYSERSQLGRGSDSKLCGFSVRCLRD